MAAFDVENALENGSIDDKGPDIFNLDQPVNQEVLNMAAFDVENALENGSIDDKGPDIFNLDQPVNQEVLNMAAFDVENALENGSIDDEELRKLWEEYKELKQVHKCKICLNREINTVFLPCGHYATCNECASRIKNWTCCVCRCAIENFLTISGGCYIVKFSREISPLIENEPRQSDVLVAHLVTAAQVSRNVD